MCEELGSPASAAAATRFLCELGFLQRSATKWGGGDVGIYHPLVFLGLLTECWIILFDRQLLTLSRRYIELQDAGGVYEMLISRDSFIYLQKYGSFQVYKQMNINNIE